MQAFKSMIRILKETSFNAAWSFIFNFTFDFISSTQVRQYIENLGGIEYDDFESSDSAQSDPEDKDEDKEY